MFYNFSFNINEAGRRAGKKGQDYGIILVKSLKTQKYKQLQKPIPLKINIDFFM